MNSLLKLSAWIDAFNSRVGRWLSWLVLIVVLISAANAVVRKVFDLSSNSFLELQWVIFSVIFLLCSPWTLAQNEHIRIDIVNQMLPLRVRSWIDMVGHVLFLLPFCIVMVIYSVPFFLSSYRIHEQSFSAGGLPQWPAKSLLMIGFLLLLIQCISEIIKRAAIMHGDLPDPHQAQPDRHPAEVEAERIVSQMPLDAR